MPGDRGEVEDSPGTGISSSLLQVRTKTPCVNCESRQIFCNKGRPRCTQCEDNRLQCKYNDAVHVGGDQRADSQAPDHMRDRVRLACLPCRQRKVRCSGSTDFGTSRSCDRCVRLDIDCAWSSKRKRPVRKPGERSISSSFDNSPLVGRQVSPSNSGLAPASPQVGFDEDESRTSDFRPLGMMDQAEVLRLITLYFSTIHHHNALGFIHPPSFYRLLDAGKAPTELTAVMIACTLRCACEPTPSNLTKADAIFDSVQPALLQQVYHRYGAIELMTMVLARLFENSRGDFAAAWMIWGNVVRMMQFLSLQTFDQTYADAHSRSLHPLLLPEAMRRLAWSIFYQDTWMDAGRRDYHLVNASDMHIQLPSDDASFLGSVEISTQHLPSTMIDSTNISPNIGILGHLVISGDMRRRILHFRSAISYSSEDPQSMLRRMEDMEKELRAIIGILPRHLAYTESNLFVQSDLRPVLTLLHLLRHNCFLMLALTRLDICALDSSLEPVSWQWRQDRIRHAIAVSRIVQDILRLHISCDINIGAQVYTAVEALLFDPVHLSRVGKGIKLKSEDLRKPLEVLLELIRREARRHEHMRNLHLEACRRLAHFGYRDLLLPTDESAFNGEKGLAGPESDEFDWLSMPWNRFEPRDSTGISKTSVRQDMLYHGRPLHSVAASRAVSPAIDAVDARDVMQPRLDPSSTFNTNLDPSFALDASQTPSTSTHLNGDQGMFDDLFPVDLPSNLLYPLDDSGPSFLEQNRWMDLNYGFGLELPDTNFARGMRSSDQGMTSSLLSDQGEGSGDAMADILGFDVN